MRRTKEAKIQLFGFIGTIIMMCMMFLCLSLTSFAAEGKITADSAKIRKEASTSSTMVGSAARGETYTINNEVTGADGMVWYQISYEEDKLGYVRSDLMQKSGSATVTTPATSPAADVTEVQPVNATVTADIVNVRSNASTGGNIVAKVRKNTVVTINGQSADSTGKTWYRVTFTSESGEVTGFIRYDFMTISGEVVPAGSVPVVDDPVVDIPVVDDPVNIVPDVQKDYETVQEEGVWKLIDYEAGQKYKIDDLFNAAVKNEELFKKTMKTVNTQKVWLVILAFLVIGLGVVATLLFLKVREVTDEAYFSAIEKETIRQRQAADARNKNVMHTVGASSKPAATRQTTQAKSSVPKMNMPKTTDPAKKTAGSMPQTIKSSNPSDTRTVRPSQSTSARTEAPRQNAKPAAKNPANTAVRRPEEKKPTAGSKQTKNFMLDDDDEFEFEFLNIDSEDDI